MKVRFLKDHLDYKENEVAEVSEERGNYFIRTEVVEKHSENNTNIAKSKSIAKTKK